MLSNPENGKRISLKGLDLSGIDFSRCNLSGVDFTGANFTGANLTGANLTGANLTGANLTGVNLTGAILCQANLSNADLSKAILTGVGIDDKTVLKGIKSTDATCKHLDYCKEGCYIKIDAVEFVSIHCAKRRASTLIKTDNLKKFLEDPKISDDSKLLTIFSTAQDKKLFYHVDTQKILTQQLSKLEPSTHKELNIKREPKH